VSETNQSGETVSAQPAPRPRILVLANQKGGVGKTTTAINLGTALAAVGERVLVVDLDPQGNASTGLGVDRADRTLSTYDVLIGAALIENAIVPTKVPGLDLVPSTMDLLGAELELASVPRRSHRLRDALSRMPPAGRELEDVPETMNERPYTYMLVDCPPSLNLLTINAMTAADSILVPLQCEFFALEGLSQLLRTVERVRTSLNPRLDIQGIVLTMFDKRNNLSGQVAKTCGRTWATKFTKPLFRVMFAFQKRLLMANQPWFMTINVRVVGPI